MTLTNLLERAFNEGSVQPNSRPTPREWVRELDTLRNSLRSCSQNSSHQYIGTFGSCPWCNLEQSSGVLYFLSSLSRVVGDVFDINRVWALIQAIQPPTNVVEPKTVSSENYTPRPLSPLPSLPSLPEIPTFESFGPLPTIPTLESFDPIPALPSFPPLPIPLPSHDPPIAIPALSKGSKVVRIFHQMGFIQWTMVSILIASAFFLNNSLFLFICLIYFGASLTRAQRYLDRRKNALVQAEIYAREKNAHRESILHKLKSDIATETARREKITKEAKAKADDIILSTQKEINKAQQDFYAEVQRRKEIINQAQKKDNEERENRKKIITAARLQANNEVTRRKEALRKIKIEWDKKLDDWHKNDWYKSFNQKKKGLELIKQKWFELRDSYDSNRDQEVLLAYLDSFLIQDAKISGIGKQKKMNLRAWGIETARDVIESKVIQVPGFGSKRTGDLVSWRNNLEAQFHRLPQSRKNNIPTPELDQKYAQHRSHWERSLRSGPEELQNIKKQIEQEQSKFLEECHQLAQRLAQAEADASVLP
jgi:hypothetical protein